ncbi:hypothetical protein DFH08DRAFT_1023725 [Mycena albidolilacea]|uniref:Uncharacterized protein n=1 Tax=Mycena albidolilacea TaxID=1033008 RepID=A0AAD6ZLU0_9AGAR|nr:hypothetical protein DFH08DRAFT_1023725 [Mycena albidolilacea]
MSFTLRTSLLRSSRQISSSSHFGCSSSLSFIPLLILPPFRLTLTTPPPSPLRGPPYTIGTTFLMRVLDPLPTRARSRKRGPGAWWLCRVGHSELRREGRLRRRYDGIKCALFDAGGDLNIRRHRRRKSGHFERAAEVALHTGEALVPRLTALYRVRPCASRVRELGNLEACGSRLKNGGGREDKVMREV